jgi:hypothetical protein
MNSKRYPHFGNPPKVPFMNNGNFKMLLNMTLFNFNDHAFFSHVYVADLYNDFFSVKNSSKLLYLPYKPKFTDSDVHKLNDNMNILADRLRTKGIELIYIPFVNKYTLYYKWLINKKYPESQFFEVLRPLPKRYEFIDTKKLLIEELKRGEKDIFYSDDTHSSWKASKKIVENLKLSN